MTEKINFTMTKPHSPHIIEFTTDEDPHFCNVLMRKAKSGALVCSHYILSSDIQQFVSMYERDGFTLKNK